MVFEHTKSATYLIHFVVVFACDLEDCKVPALFALIRIYEACICKSSGPLKRLKEQQWQCISGLWSMRQRYPIGGLEGGFLPLQVVQG